MDCNDCGKCCEELESLPIFEPIYQKIKNIRPDIEKFAKKIGGMYYIDLNYSTCPFYDLNTKKCSIYKVRPLICREFPFKFSTKIPTTYLIRNIDDLNLKEVISFGLCDRFDTVTESDYNNSIKIMRYSLLQYKKLFKKKINILLIDQHLKDLESNKRKFIKEMNYQKYLDYCKLNPNFVNFTRLLITYFKNKTFNDNKEYRDFLLYYSPKFEQDPSYIDIAISDIEKRIK
jgi:Fe-S-cluster containining protein